jgi:hypothetical protein
MKYKRNLINVLTGYQKQKNVLLQKQVALIRNAGTLVVVTRFVQLIAVGKSLMIAMKAAGAVVALARLVQLIAVGKSLMIAMKAAGAVVALNMVVKRCAL